MTEQLVKPEPKAGKCKAVVCKAACEQYADGRRLDGWQLCVCGHSKAIHLETKGRIKK